MAERDFFNVTTKERARRVVTALEAKTKAEIVLAVRRKSGDYRHSSYLAGFALSLVALGVLLFSPVEFAVHTMPLDVVLFFALGALVTSRSPALERLFSSRSQLTDRVRVHSRSTFLDLNVDHTRGRVGVLVYASLLEAEAEIVVDRAIPGGAQRYDTARERIALAVRRRDIDAFFAGIEALGDLLVEALPVGVEGHGENELPDGVE